MLGSSALWERTDSAGAEMPSVGAITPQVIHLGSFLPPPPQTGFYKTYSKNSGLVSYTAHPDEMKSEAKQGKEPVPLIFPAWKCEFSQQHLLILSSRKKKPGESLFLLRYGHQRES